jgi:hypothetical protein
MPCVQRLGYLLHSHRSTKSLAERGDPGGSVKCVEMRSIDQHLSHTNTHTTHNLKDDLYKFEGHSNRNCSDSRRQGDTLARMESQAKLLSVLDVEEGLLVKFLYRTGKV